MKPKGNRKKRANKIFVKFNTKLSNQSLNGLANDMRFMGKFVGTDIIKHNENVIGIHGIDPNKIDYSISIEGIEAFSLYLRDKIVEQKLSKFAQSLLGSIGRKRDDFIIDSSAKHDYLQEFDNSKLLNKNFVDGINQLFKKKGVDRAIFQSIKILIEKDKKPKGVINIYYTDSESYKRKEILIEAKSNIIFDIVKIIKEFK